VLVLVLVPPTANWDNSTKLWKTMEMSVAQLVFWNVH